MDKDQSDEEMISTISTSESCNGAEDEDFLDITAHCESKLMEHEDETEESGDSGSLPLEEEAVDPLQFLEVDHDFLAGESALKVPLNICKKCGCLKSLKSIHSDSEDGKINKDTNKLEENIIFCECENSILTKCKVCKKLVKETCYNAHLQNHKNTVTKHSCKICGKSFLFPAHLRSHVVSHVSEKTFFCHICNKSFSSLKSLKNHRSFCEKPKTYYQCNECNESFSNKRVLFNHLKIHEKVPEESLSCEICCIEFDSSSSKKEHIMQVHVEALRFVCSTCGEAFVTESAMKQHSKTHERIYPCSHCEAVFPRQKDLLAHRLIHNFKRIRCKVCHQFYSAREYANHKLTECFGSNRGNYCELCNKWLKGSKSCLRKHIQTHTPLSERSVICDTCNKNFCDKSALRKHIRLVHTEDRPYICEFCSKSFNQLCKLKYHIVIHSKDKSVPCTVCGKTFSTDKDVQIHMRVHTGEKPYKCSTCGKQFRQRGHVTSHQLVHTKLRPFTCSFCDKTFGLPSSLKKHLKLHTTNITITSKI